MSKGQLSHGLESVIDLGSYGIGAATDRLRERRHIVDARFTHEVGVLTDSLGADYGESEGRQPHMEDLDEFVV